MKKEFKYVFQVTKLITFEVSYYTLGNNSTPHFTTSANEFIRSKRDYDRCGQAQNDLLTGKAKQFYKKWDNLHLKDLTDNQYSELLADIEILKDKYNYLEKIKDTFKNTKDDFSFYQIVEFSKQKLK